MSDLKAHLATVADGKALDEAAARDAFSTIMAGEATPSQIGAFLMGLRVRGETVDEITGAVGVMRDRMSRVDAPDDAFDIVGTGGDGSGTYNISTCAAFVLAATGLPIAKHGNRALSSRSGAADVLSALGIRTDLASAGVARCIREAGIGFMFAPNHHTAMRHVGPSRVEMGTRTIFNLLGPLSNPAGVRRQLVGVFSPEWCEPLAHVLLRLGTERAWIVHGSGLDELTTAGETLVAELADGAVTMRTVRAADAGLPDADMADLIGGTGEENAVALRGVLDGQRNAYRDVVVLNAAAGLVAAGRADDLRSAAVTAAARIDDGSARATLDRLIEVSNA